MTLFDWIYQIVSFIGSLVSIYMFIRMSIDDCNNWLNKRKK